MKGSGKIIVLIAAVTSLFILYVHGQVTLFRVSYQIEDQNDVLKSKVDQFRQLQYDVERLQAPRRLEKELTKLNIDLAEPQQIHVVRVPVMPSLPLENMGQVADAPGSSGLFDFFGKWIGVAQAKTEN